VYKSELPHRTFLKPWGIAWLLDGSSRTALSRHRMRLVSGVKIALILLRLSLLILLPSALAGCGTLIHGTSQDVVCVSNPAGALVRTADGTTCTTPCTVKLKRTKDNSLTMEREGYEPVILPVHSSLSKTSAGEVLLPGGLICWGIDLASGAAFHLRPERVDVSLKPSTNEDGTEKAP